jgi:hypothetical protein
MGESMSTPQLSLVLIKYRDNQDIQPSLNDIKAFFSKFQIPYEIKIGESKLLSQLIESCQSPYVIVCNAELSSPLGDAFKILQEIMTNPDLDIGFGNRFKKKNSPFHANQGSRSKLDHLYTPIFRQHLSNLFEDPLCDLLAFKKSFWDKLQENHKTEINQLRWTPYFQRLAVDYKIRSADIPIYDNGQTPSDWPNLKRKFQMMWLSSKFR